MLEIYKANILFVIIDLLAVAITMIFPQIGFFLVAIVKR